MVLRGMDLLLDCIASGVYVRSAPSSSPAVGGGGASVRTFAGTAGH